MKTVDREQPGPVGWAARVIAVEDNDPVFQDRPALTQERRLSHPSPVIMPAPRRRAARSAERARGAPNWGLVGVRNINYAADVAHPRFSPQEADDMIQDLPIKPATWLSSAPIPISQSGPVLSVFLPGTAKVVRF